MIKDEYRKQWIKVIKKPMNFFKHADNDLRKLSNSARLKHWFHNGRGKRSRFLGEQTVTPWVRHDLASCHKPNWITQGSANSARSGWIDELQEFKLVQVRLSGFSFAQAMRPARSL